MRATAYRAFATGEDLREGVLDEVRQIECTPPGGVRQGDAVDREQPLADQSGRCVEPEGSC